MGFGTYSDFSSGFDKFVSSNNKWFSHFSRIRILLEDKDDEVFLRGHEDLVTGGLEPQEGQGVGRIEVADYRFCL